MAKAKTDEENVNKNVSIDILSDMLKEYSADHYNNEKSEGRIISTGSLILDSLVKVRTGSVVRLIATGPELGKTSQAFVFAENYMNTVPNSKTIYVKSEARLSPEMQARTGLKFVTSPKDWVAGTVFIFSTNVFEVISKTLETLLHAIKGTDERLCIILDSLDGCILKSDLEKNVWDGKETVKVAGVPLLTKLLFRRLGLLISATDSLFVITSQYSAEIKIDPYSKEPPRPVIGSGGSAIAHQTDYVFSYAPRYMGDYICEDESAKPDTFKNKILGVYATVEIKKSGTDVTGSKVKIPIRKGRIGCAIWGEKECVDYMLGFGLIKRSGAWYSIDKNLTEQAKVEGIEFKDQYQGLQSIYSMMESDKKAFNWLYTKIKNTIV